MKTHQVSEKFIIEAYENACSEWQEKIREQLPHLFPTVEVGQWYKTTEKPYLLFLVQNIKHGKFYGVGFNNGEWEDDDLVWADESDYIAKASTEEVRKALTKEAEKRGYIKGVYIKSLGGAGTVAIDVDTSLFYVEGYDKTLLRANKDCLIFREGEWAKIQNTITKEAAEKKYNIIIV